MGATAEDECGGPCAHGVSADGVGADWQGLLRAGELEQCQGLGLMRGIAARECYQWLRRVARMVAADGLPSRTDCRVLATSRVNLSDEALPSALVKDTSAYDTRHAHFRPPCCSVLCVAAGWHQPVAPYNSMLDNVHAFGDHGCLCCRGISRPCRQPLCVQVMEPAVLRAAHRAHTPDSGACGSHGTSHCQR